MPELQNHAIDRLLENLKHHYVGAAAIEFAFRNAPKGCPLREILVRESVEDVDEFVEEEMSQLGSVPGFFGEFVDRMRVCRRSSDCKHNEACTPSKRIDRNEWYVKTGEVDMHE